MFVATYNPDLLVPVVLFLTWSFSTLFPVSLQTTSVVDSQV